MQLFETAMQNAMSVSKETGRKADTIHTVMSGDPLALLLKAQ